MKNIEEYQFNKLTWQEMNDSISAQKVVILPTGATEQHDPHLPLDVDSFLCETVCLEVGKRIPEQVLILPVLSYGLNLHHIDFPGTIHIEPEVFISFCLNITKSLAYHGFEKIIIVNGHGSNYVLADIAARKTVLSTQSLCAAVNYFSFAVPEFMKIRESDTIAHADELETSLYLHLAPERVRKDRMVAGEDVMGKYVSSDSVAKNPVRFSDYWGRWTKTGVHGDPTVATAEKGKILFETAVNELVAFVKEWKEWPLEKRADQHSCINKVQTNIIW